MRRRGRGGWNMESEKIMLKEKSSLGRRHFHSKSSHREGRLFSWVIYLPYNQVISLIKNLEKNY
jgi:hypothetical protein